MATSTINNYIGNGTTDSFLIGFDYLRKSFVKVFLDDVLQELGVDYEFSTDNVVTFNTAPANGVSIVIMRDTIIDETIVNYIDPAILSANDLNRSFTQPLHLLQEMQDDITELNINHDIYGNIDLGGTRIINSGQPINDNDLATKKYVDDNDDALRTFIESVDSDLLDLSNNVDGKIGQVVQTFNAQVNDVSNSLNNKIDDLEIVVNNNNTSINDSLLQHVDNLQTQIDSIDIAGVKISAETDNAIIAKSDGLFVPDLSTDVNGLLSSVQALDDDSTAQWVKINDTLNRVATNTNNIAENHSKINTNTINIAGLDERVFELEGGAGGGFNTIDYITTSNTAYHPPVDGWYKITIIGGGGGGGSSSSTTSPGGIIRGGSGGGGGAAGNAKSMYKYLSLFDTISITVGGYGLAGVVGGAGGAGGRTIFTINGIESYVGGGEGGTAAVDNNTGQGGAGYGGLTLIANAGGNGTAGGTMGNPNSTNYAYGGNGGNGGTNGTPYGGGGGGGGGAGSSTFYGFGGRMGGYGAADGVKPTTASTAAGGGRGATGAVILEYFNPNL